MPAPNPSSLNLAVTLAEREAPALPAEAWEELCQVIEAGLLEELTPEERWAFLESGLMCKQPFNFMQILRHTGGLVRILPEVDALFGVPQLSDAAETVDVGEHQERVMRETGRANAPMAVRFAALMHKIGKAGTPVEIWPSHYKHEERGHEGLEKIAARFRIPPEVLNLSHLVIDECDRVHRASEMRAGAITVMVERVRALEEPERFERLLMVCTCDYAAYEGHSQAEYPKAERLRRAAAACRSVKAEGLSRDALLEARALAVAEALKSLAWDLEPQSSSPRG